MITTINKRTLDESDLKAATAGSMSLGMMELTRTLTRAFEAKEKGGDLMAALLAP